MPCFGPYALGSAHTLSDTAKISVPSMLPPFQKIEQHIFTAINIQRAYHGTVSSCPQLSLFPHKIIPLPPRKILKNTMCLAVWLASFVYS